MSDEVEDTSALRARVMRETSPEGLLRSELRGLLMVPESAEASSGNDPALDEAVEAGASTFGANEWRLGDFTDMAAYREMVRDILTAAAPVFTARHAAEVAHIREDLAESQAGRASLVSARDMLEQAVRDQAAAFLAAQDGLREAHREQRETEMAGAEQRGREQAAQAIESHAESIGWYEDGGVWAEALELARGQHVTQTTARGATPTPSGGEAGDWLEQFREAVHAENRRRIGMGSSADWRSGLLYALKLAKELGVETPAGGEAVRRVIHDALCSGGEEQHDVHLGHDEQVERILAALTGAGFLPAPAPPAEEPAQAGRTIRSGFEGGPADGLDPEVRYDSGGAMVPVPSPFISWQVDGERFIYRYDRAEERDDGPVWVYVPANLPAPAEGPLPAFIKISGDDEHGWMVDCRLCTAETTWHLSEVGAILDGYQHATGQHPDQQDPSGDPS